MLSKLLKYELLATGRIMLPLYDLLIVASAALGTNMSLSGDGPQGVFTVILLILFTVSVAAVFIATFTLMLVRFYRNLLGDEGYLMFSLPTSTGRHIASKVICPLIWICCSLGVGLLCGFIMERLLGIGGDQFYEQVKLIWNMLMGRYGSAGSIRILILLVVTGILSILESIVEVYAAMSVGHLWSNHRIIGSVLAYIGFSACETIITQVFHLEKVLEKIQASAVVSNSAGMEVNITWLNSIVPNSLWIMGIALVELIIYGTITWYVLDRRLNLV